MWQETWSPATRTSEPECVLVAVGADFRDMLDIARGFALFSKARHGIATSNARCLCPGSKREASAFKCATISKVPSSASVTTAVTRPLQSKRGEKGHALFERGLVARRFGKLGHGIDPSWLKGGGLLGPYFTRAPSS